MKAKNEAESLQHMAVSFGDDELLSGRNQAWTAKKVVAITSIHNHWRDNAAGHFGMTFRMLDMGIGDMRYLEQWASFNDIHYTGVDGSPTILAVAAERHPYMSFRLSSFGDFLDDCQHPPLNNLVAAVDVLYHIPEDSVHDDLLDFVLGPDGAHKYAMVSFATNMSQVFDGGSKPGDGGFSWFPRPFVLPDGWEVLYSADQPAGMTQHQRLLALARR